MNDSPEKDDRPPAETADAFGGGLTMTPAIVIGLGGVTYLAWFIAKCCVVLSGSGLPQLIRNALWLIPHALGLLTLFGILLALLNARRRRLAPLAIVIGLGGIPYLAWFIVKCCVVLSVSGWRELIRNALVLIPHALGLLILFGIFLALLNALHRRLAPLALALVIGMGGIPYLAWFVHWYEVGLFENRGREQLLLHTLTPLVFLCVLLLAGLLNPLLHRVAPRLVLGGRELFLVLSLWLITGVVCYMNLAAPVFHTIGNTMNTDIQRPMTGRVGFTEHLRPGLFLPTAETKRYHLGLGDGSTWVAATEVPWRLWLKPLCFWAPFMLLLIVFARALVRVVHRQWSRHELLTYPLAEFAGSLLEREPQRAFPKVFYDKVFWCGFILIGLVYLINGLHLWYPLMIEVPLSFSHTGVIKKFPFLNQYCGREAYSLFRGWLYPFVVCLAVLLPTEISLSCWMGWVLMVLFTGVYFLFTGVNIGPTETGFIQSGMYVGMLLMIIGIGRREYANILRQALTWRPTEDRELRAAAAACRVLVLAALGLFGLLVYAGLDWVVAAVVMASFSLVLLLIARMTAEIGIPWLVSFGGTTRLLSLRLLGPLAIGPKGLAIMAAVVAVMDFSTSNAMAAQATTIDKLRERHDPGGRGLLPLVWTVGLILALTASGASILWNNYSFGARQETGLVGGIHRNFDTASVQINRLTVENAGVSETESKGLAKLLLIDPEPGFWRFFFLGGVIVLGCALMRLRFTWWPLHPLPLLLINTWCMSRLFFSFLVAWLIKMALVKIGGGKVFMRAKPFFIGVIAGQIVVVGFWVLAGLMAYSITGEPPDAVRFFIG